MPELKKDNCRSCKAPVYWLGTATGKAVIVDVRPRRVYTPDMSDPERKTFKITEGYESHFATCPDADKWRKKK